jgi:hypothetical protein
MVEPLRHRQTKGAATDMFYLKLPRHISTLRKAAVHAQQHLVVDKHELEMESVAR